MRHEINIGRHIDEVRRSEGGYLGNQTTTYLMVEDMWVSSVIKDLQSALADLERIKR